MNRGIKELNARERKIYLLLGSLFFAAFAAGFTYIKPLNDIDYIFSDHVYESLVSSSNEKSDIKIISIDEKTKEIYGDYPTWSRSRLASLLEKLNTGENAPDVIGVNLDLEYQKDTAGDNALIEVCRKYDNICMAGILTTEEEQQPLPMKNPSPADTKNSLDSSTAPRENPAAFDSPVLPGAAGTAAPPLSSSQPDYLSGKKINGIRLPFSRLLETVSTGIVNANKNGPDGNVRSCFAGIKYAGTEYDSFSIAIYKMHLANKGQKYHMPSVDGTNAFSINFAREKSRYEYYSYADVLNGQIDCSLFNNSIVLITNVNNLDSFPIPGQNIGQVPETELQAQIINALLQNHTLQYAAKWFLAIWYAVFSAAFFIVTSYNSRLRSLIDSVGLIILEIIACVLLNYTGYYIPLLQLMIIIVLIATANLFLTYLISKRQKKELEKAFKKYVDGQIVDEIVNNGAAAASIGVIRKDISVLFIDIRGFTSLSENLPPEQIVDILNHYLTVIANAVAKNGGTLDKFIGDAAMAVFNSPFDLEDYVYKSVCTAWDILSNAAWLNQFCQNKYGREIAFGIGIHCGDAVVGNIGSPSRMDYTAIGDTVNTSSRLESSAAKGQILISREVRKRLDGRIETKFSGKYTLKGKKMPVDAYELTDIIDYTSEIQEQELSTEKTWKLPSLDKLGNLSDIEKYSNIIMRKGDKA